MKRTRCSFFAWAVVVFIFPLASFAMTSTNYQINWDDLNSGGNESGTSTNYLIHDTISGFGIGSSTSSSYNLESGYRSGESSAALSLSIHAQEKTVKVAYTNFSATATSVTVASAADFTLGDYITVVENDGFAAKVAMGKINAIAGSLVYFDAFEGSTSTMSQTTSGGNDFVYRAMGSSAAYGTIVLNAQNTAITVAEVQSTVSTGYTVYLQANGALRSTSSNATIASVADGLVTAGVEEYGACTIGTTALLSQSDFAVPTTQLGIQSRSSQSVAPGDRAATIFKLSIADTTPSSIYVQSVYYTLTANY